MKTTITARHCDLTEDMRARATTIIERLGKLAYRPQSAEVLFDDDHKKKVVELILHLPRGHTRVASAEAGDFVTALDRAADKLKHQLGKDDPVRPARRGKQSA